MSADADDEMASGGKIHGIALSWDHTVPVRFEGCESLNANGTGWSG